MLLVDNVLIVDEKCFWCVIDFEIQVKYVVVVVEV